MRLMGILAVGVVVSAVLSSSAVAAGPKGDWYQWRGPNRNSICTETNLLKEWPADGPKLLWKLTGLGVG